MNDHEWWVNSLDTGLQVHSWLHMILRAAMELSWFIHHHLGCLLSTESIQGWEMVTHPTNQEKRKWLNNSKFPFLILTELASGGKSSQDNFFTNSPLSLEIHMWLRKNMKKPSVKTKQLQLLDKVAMKSKAMDISIPSTWNTGERTNHGLECNAQKLSHWQALFSLMFPALGEGVHTI